MVMASQFSLDSSSSLNLSSKSSNSLSNNASNKTSQEVDSIFDKNKSNSKESNKKDDFKNVLNSSRKYDEKNEKLDNSEKETQMKELKDKIQEFKEKSEENCGDEKEVTDIIESILNILNKLIDLNNNTQINSKENTESMNINQLLEQNNIDSETLTEVKELLGQLIDTDKTSDKMKNDINDILSKITDMIDESNTDGRKVLSLEDMLNNGYSQEQNSFLGDSDSGNSDMFSSNSSNKEEKFLDSLLEDKSDNSIDNKISMFSARSQAIQTQNTEVRVLTVNKTTFASDLIKDVKYMSANNIKELTVKVNPGNLGEITIKLIQEDGLMKANLKANSKETTVLLSQNLTEIKKELGEQNIKISEVNVELYNDDTTYFKDGSFGGTLSQEHGRNESNSLLADNQRISMNSQEEDEIIINNAEINSALDFLA